MDLKFEVTGATTQDIQRLAGMISPAPQPQAQDVSSSIEAQAMLRQIAALTQVVEGLVVAQQTQPLLPQRVEVQYAQPQLGAGPVFPAIAPAITVVPDSAARYQTEPTPTAVTTIQVQAEEAPGYAIPGWANKVSGIVLPALAGCLIAWVLSPLLPWFRSLQQPPAEVAPKAAQPAKGIPNSANLLKVPDEKAPVQANKNPPPYGVLGLPAIPVK